VRSKAFRVATAPCLGVFPRELFNLLPIVGHLYATLDRPLRLSVSWKSDHR
jgi:hypothetical protein